MPKEPTPLKKISAIIGRQLRLHPQREIWRSARLREDLGADSLDEVEIGMQIEEEFGLKFDLQMGVGVQTVEELAAMVERLLAQKAEIVGGAARVAAKKIPLEQRV